MNRALVVLLCAACGGGGGGGGGAPADAAVDAPGLPAPPGGGLVSVGGPERPFLLRIPSGYDPTRPAPLIVLLHGYSFSGIVQDALLGLSRMADDVGFILAAPDGTIDGRGARFWNATDACCNYFGSSVDDVAYIAGILDFVAAHYRVDPARVALMGHSNGGFMAYRAACELAPRVKSIAVIAGATWSDPTRCTPAAPVSVLHLHGTDDDVILYGGGGIPNLATYPSARATVAAWAAYDGCASAPGARGMLDVDFYLPGDETVVEGYGGCAGGADVELWTITMGGHVPFFQPAAIRRAIDWLTLAR